MGASAVPIGLGVLGLLGQSQAAKAQKAASSPQRTIAGMQKGLFAQASPYYASILQALAGNAGMGLPGQAPPGTPPLAKTGAGFGTPGAPMGSGGQPGLPMGSTAMPENALGIFGQGADRQRFAAAEEDLSRIRQQRNAELLLGLTRQGAGAATTSAALARNEGDYQRDLAGSRRQLAISAEDEATQRVLQLLGALSPGLGLGQASAGIYADQANRAAAGGQAGMAATGDALQAYLMYQALKRQRQPTDITL